MSESGDYNPVAWKGHDFASARRSYDATAGRSYKDAVTAGKVSKDLIPDSVETDSDAPLIIVVDETGSMGEDPATIFSKLPYLENEGKEYLGPNFEVCFMAIGDAHNNEKYPLQVRPFAKGLDMGKRIKELIHERQGGGSYHETYELAALYANEKVKIPKAIKPIIIFVGDEQPYDTVSKDHAKNYVGIDIEKTLTTEAVFKKLKDKYSVYFILKPYERYSDNKMSPVNKMIYEAWEKLLGADHISYLPDANRIVDVIFGILAKESGRIAYFEEELEDRQTPEQVATVYKSLKTIHKLTDADIKPKTGKSVMRKSTHKTDETAVKPLV
jgi:hypothetical protein